MGNNAAEMMEFAEETFARLCRFADAATMYGGKVLCYLILVVATSYIWFIGDAAIQQESRWSGYFVPAGGMTPEEVTRIEGLSCLASIVVLSVGCTVTFGVFFLLEWCTTRMWYDSVYLHASSWVTGVNSLILCYNNWTKVPKWAAFFVTLAAIVLSRLFFQVLHAWTQRHMRALPLNDGADDGDDDSSQDSGGGGGGDDSDE